MFIKDILCFDKGGREAEAIVSDGVYSLICYASPIDIVEKGMGIPELFAFSCTNIMRAAVQSYSVTKLSQYYAYLLTAQVYSKHANIAYIGGLRINIDAHIPDDISVGEYISFVVQRLDFA